MRISILATIFIVSIFSGCASVTTGQNQSLSVETPGCKAASCKLSNDKGTWFVASTPGTVTVNRAYGDMNVTCEKGDAKATSQFKSNTKGMAFGNVLLGGVIGAGVDVATGAAYDYPPVLAVDLRCGASAAAAPQAPATPAAASK